MKAADQRQRRRHQAKQHGRRPGESGAAPARHQQQVGDGGGEQRRAQIVDAAAVAWAYEPGQRAAAQDEGSNAQGQIDPEYPAPREIIDEEAAQDRAADARRRPHAAQIALVAAALARRDHVGDDRLRHADEAAAAQPLQGACGDELRHVLRRGAQPRGDDEEGDGGLQQHAAAIEVAQLAVDRRRRGRGQQIGRDDPRQPLEPVELAGDRRQRGGDDALVERRQHHAEQDAAQDDEDLAMREGAVRRARLGRRRRVLAPLMLLTPHRQSQPFVLSPPMAPQHSNGLSSGHPRAKPLSWMPPTTPRTAPSSMSAPC